MTVATQDNGEKQNGLANDYDAASKKEAEANGVPMKDNASDTTDEESGLPNTKRGRRRDCVYITIVMLLGAALIGLVIYLLVVNILKEPAAEPVGNGQGQSGSLVTTTEEPTTTTTAATTTAGFGGPESRLRDLRNMRRSMPLQ